MAQVILLLMATFFIASVVGSLTGWFRTGMDLVETSFLIGNIALAALFLLPIHILILIKKIKGRSSVVATKLCAYLTFGYIIVTVITKVITFGGMYPPLVSVYETYKHEVVDSAGQKISYWVEIVDPFGSARRERLVLLQAGKKEIIDISLLDSSGAFFDGPKNLNIEFQGVNLLLESRMDLEPRYVLLNRESGSVISNWGGAVRSQHLTLTTNPPPRGAEGGGGSESSHP